MFRNVITTEHELRDLMGEASEGSIKKETTYLTDECIQFIEKSPFMLLATSGANGRCDVAPKGDPSGFVRVLDEKHLVIPDRPGNKRFDGLRNIFENPQIGLIFLVPGRHETLRVNGRAWITRTRSCWTRCRSRASGRGSRSASRSKSASCTAARRSCARELWEPASWPDLATVPSGGQMLKGTQRGVGATVEEIDDVCWRATAPGCTDMHPPSALRQPSGRGVWGPGHQQPGRPSYTGRPGADFLGDAPVRRRWSPWHRGRVPSGCSRRGPSRGRSGRSRSCRQCSRPLRRGTGSPLTGSTARR